MTIKSKEKSDILIRLQQLLSESSIVSFLRQRNACSRGESITKNDIEQLIKNNNHCSDWSRIKKTGTLIADTIHGCTFSEDVVIGQLDGEQEYRGAKFKCGLRDSFIQNSWIADQCVVQHVSCLSGASLGRGCLMVDVGSLRSFKNNSFGAGLSIRLGNEQSLKSFVLCAEWDYGCAKEYFHFLQQQKPDQFSEEWIQGYLEDINISCSYLGDSVRLMHVPCLENVLIGSNCVIEGAGLVKNSTILSSEDAPAFVGAGVIIESSQVQKACKIQSGASLKQSLLMEYSTLENRVYVHDSVIAPNNILGQGEIAASFVGPFVGMHHQSLLVAADWSCGLGNIACGANVGSNHTGRLPDQGLRCAEGIFFGLGCSVKFPINLEKSPYLFVAAGLIVPSQKIEFPFALIRSPSKKCSGDHVEDTEIIPAWVLLHNLYGLERNERKYGERQCSPFSRIDYRYLKPSTIDLMMQARDRLGAVQVKKDIYTAKDIDGLGKCVLSEENRIAAIQGYEFFVRYYALYSLIRDMEKIKETSLEAAKDDVEWDSFVENTHWSEILVKEFGKRSAPSYIHEWIAVRQDFLLRLRETRHKDYVRGMKIFEDYDKNHKNLDDDPLWCDLEADTKRWNALCHSILGSI